MPPGPSEQRQIVETILSERLDGPIRLDEGTAIADRDYVLRFVVVDGPPTAPASVIVKRPAPGDEYAPDAVEPSNAARVLLTDWTGLQFLQDVAGDVLLAPRFYGGDRRTGLVVSEDLGNGVGLDAILMGDDPVLAETALVEIAAALGRLHARTMGHHADFERIRAGHGAQLPPWRDFPKPIAPAMEATLAVFGIPAPPGLAAELRAVDTAMAQPGPFLAYTHGDPCPDNWLRVDGQLRLLDFEAGAYRHALLDGVYGRIHFPTCWCVNRIPAHIPRRMEEVYRAELVQGCSETADDTLFRRAVVEACAYWFFTLCDWIVERPAWYAAPQILMTDKTWGISTDFQRVLLRADILEHTTQEHDYLKAIGAAVAAIAARLRAVWPADADLMPLYPAFRAGSA